VGHRLWGSASALLAMSIACFEPNLHNKIFVIICYVEYSADSLQLFLYKGFGSGNQETPDAQSFAARVSVNS
jgi:hypothetical protein